MAPPPFSHLTPPASSSKSPAVDAILAEAMDLCALEQIAALNTAHLSDSSLLPTDLEARFRKLRSFPAASPIPKASAAAEALDRGKENVPRTLNRSETIPDPPPAAFKPDEPDESEKPYVGLDPKSGSGFSSSPSIPHKSPRDSPSPPRQACCFGFSPKKGHRSKDKDVGALGGLDPELEEWMDNKKILVELKDQQKKLKKAVKEQQKVSREAARMVRLAKHASARMNTTIDEVLSSDDELK